MSVTFSNAVGQKLVERTNTLIKVPNNYGILNRLNLFTDRYVSQKNIEAVRKIYGQNTVTDRNWDERNQNVSGRAADYVRAKIPHFPVDDRITPNDLDGLAQFTGAESDQALLLETVASIRMEKMENIRQAHALTLDAARAQLINDGSVYAPNGTLKTSYGSTINWYNEWNITRTNQAVNLGTGDDPRPDFTNVKNTIQDNLQNGQVATGWLCLCSPTFFSTLATNPYLTDAVKYTPSALNSSILTGTLDSRGYGMLGQSFEAWGITFIEMRGSYVVNGVAVPYITAGEARIFPTGLSGFLETFYAPANRLSTVNRRSQGSYWFEYLNEKDDFIEIMTEQNFLNVCHQPQAIARLTIAP